jgi:hypothetical protein
MVLSLGAVEMRRELLLLVWWPSGRARLWTSNGCGDGRLEHFNIMARCALGDVCTLCPHWVLIGRWNAVRIGILSILFPAARVRLPQLFEKIVILFEV